MTSDPSSNLMNYVKFTVIIIAASLATKDCLEKQKTLPLKMASIAIMIGGAIINATAFVGGSYLAKYFSRDSESASLEEKKRHNLAVEKYQKEYEKYVENRAKLNDWIQTNDRLKDEAKQNFINTDFALKLYNKVHQQNIDHLKEPQFSDFFQPSEQQKRAELT